MTKLSAQKQMFRNIASAAVAQGIQDGVFGLEQGQNYGVPKSSATHMYYTTIASIRCRVYVTNMSIDGQELKFDINIPPGHYFSFWMRRRPGQLLVNSPIFTPLKGAVSIKTEIATVDIPFEASHEPIWLFGF